MVLRMNRRSLLSTFIAAPFASVLTARASVSKPETGAPDLIAELQAAYDGIFRDGKRPTPVDALAITKEQAIRRTLQFHEEAGHTNVVMDAGAGGACQIAFVLLDERGDEIYWAAENPDPYEARPASWHVYSRATDLDGMQQSFRAIVCANAGSDLLCSEENERCKTYWHRLDDQERYFWLVVWLYKQMDRGNDAQPHRSGHLRWMLDNAERRAGI